LESSNRGQGTDNVVNKFVKADALPDLRQSETSDMPEAEAIRLAQQGNASAFACIYRLHSRRAYTLCFRMVGNSAEADDLTQDVFLQVFRKIQTFRGEAAFSTWLHRLAVNVVLMRLRKKKLAQTSLEEATEPNEEIGKPPKEFGGPDPRLTGLVDRVNINRALGHLPPGYRLIFILHDIQGYEHKEIAEILDCSVGNSKSQLHKARMRLRQKLRGDRPQLACSVLYADRQQYVCSEPQAKEVKRGWTYS
jgi:RNA polymerase sigma-70 factor, ECF subfamily